MKKTQVAKYFLSWTLLVLSHFMGSASFGYETFYRNDSFPMSQNSDIFYFKEIQPILDKRCAACHSCREAQCGLKVTSPEAVERGATTLNLLGTGVFAGVRAKMFHDAKTVEGWRAKGFYSITEPVDYMEGNTSEVKRSTFIAALLNKTDPNYLPSEKDLLEDSEMMCDAGKVNLDRVPAMPYKMSPIGEAESATLVSWAQQSTNDLLFKEAKSDPTRYQPKSPSIIKKWEDFFNHPSNKAKWTSRYLYEHLFLARFYLEESPGEFFELVRSKTPSGKTIDILSTQKVFEKPADIFYYRLFKVRTSIMRKDHFVYKVNDQILADLKNLFWNVDWKIKDAKMPFNFSQQNPLIAFKHMPASSRYTWMLENAHLLLDISAGAQNCRSINAGAPYWDNMLHIFLKPDADATVRGLNFYDEAGPLLRIPKTKGGRNNPLDRFIGDQKKYAKIKQEYMKEIRPFGFTLSDIWDGKDGKNKNAVVTVLRHEWTARAYEGQIGVTPRSVLLLDYALFERYFYLCNVATEITEPLALQAPVVNYLFDVKKEGEDQFLSFMDQSYRQKIRENLVQGFDVNVEFGPQFAYKTNPSAKAIPIDQADPYGSFIRNFLSAKFHPDVIGTKSLVIPHQQSTQDVMSLQLQKLKDDLGFASQMPNVSYLLVVHENQLKYYSLLANRYYVSRNKLAILGSYEYEKETRLPSKDVMEVYEGIIADFPEKIYIVRSENLNSFTAEMTSIRTRADFLSFNKKFGLDQNNKNFWNIMDKVNAFHIRSNPINGGILDLHKYGSVDKKLPL